MNPRTKLEKTQKREEAHPRPTLGLDLIVDRLHDRVESRIGAENDPRVRPLQDEVSPGDQNLSRSRSNSTRREIKDQKKKKEREIKIE